jgi:hypothetical protein
MVAFQPNFIKESLCESGTENEIVSFGKFDEPAKDKGWGGGGEMV